MYAFFDLFRISYRGTFAAFMCAVLAVILLCYVIMQRKKGCQAFPLTFAKSLHLARKIFHDF